jgi:hypothetical protein
MRPSDDESRWHHERPSSWRQAGGVFVFHEEHEKDSGVPWWMKETKEATMLSQSLLLVFGVVVLVVLVIVAVFALMTRRATSGPKSAPESQQWVAQAKVEAGERESALVSEEIEELVRAKLTAYPDLARVKLDFASSSDGSLEIWVDQAHYRSVNEIPDARLRQAIQAVVQAWNDLKGG